MRRLTGFSKRKGTKEETKSPAAPPARLKISGPVVQTRSMATTPSKSPARCSSGPSATSPPAESPTRSASGGVGRPSSDVRPSGTSGDRGGGGFKGSVERESSGAGPAVLQAAPSQLTPSPVGATFVAMYDYVGKTSVELSFRRDERFKLVMVDPSNTQWLEVESLASEARGWVPAVYVTQATFKKTHLDAPLVSQPWYHGKISRSAAEFHLRRCIEGDFLIRESETTVGAYTVSVVTKGEILHYRVNCEACKLSVTAMHQFRSLAQLVAHYKVDGSMGSLLVNPVVKGRVKQLGVAADSDSRWEIDRADIVFGNQLGAGQFGEVYAATWLKYGSRMVAVKTLKKASMEPIEFLKEAEIMKTLRHPGLVQLLGVCTTSEPLLIVAEFMARGSLLDVLRSEAGRVELDSRTLLYVCTQVAGGMAFLESKNFIHRDLAARNCLVNDGLIVKIADFGLSRLLQSDGSGSGEAIYTAHEGAKFPIKWTAPEALRFNVFSTKSDVWAFGVLLWEVYTLGSNPYPGLPLQDVLPKLDSSYRMPKPELCPASVYATMLKCWEYEPDNRPPFTMLQHMLEGTEPARVGNTTPRPRGLVAVPATDELPAIVRNIAPNPLPKASPPFELHIEDSSGVVTVLRSDSTVSESHLLPPQTGHARTKSDGGGNSYLGATAVSTHSRRKSEGGRLSALEVGNQADLAIGACRAVMQTGHQLQQGQMDPQVGLEELITETSQAYCTALAMKDVRMYGVLRDIHAQVTAIQQIAHHELPPTQEEIASASHHLPQIVKRLFDIISANYH